MTFELAYLLVHIPIVPAWGLLILAPRSRATRSYVHSGFLPLLMALIYSGFLIAGVFFGQGADGAGMSNLGAVKALFSHPVGILTGWVHFIIFDLFVGAWIGRDSLEKNMPHWVTVISLIFTLMFGPIGLAIYLLSRKFMGYGNWSISENNPA